MLFGRLARASALTGGTVAYLFRPWSCGYALRAISPEDEVAYARFDYHGIGVITGWFSALLFAVPMFWLAGRIIAPTGDEQAASADPLDARVAVGSLFVAIALGAPTFTQTAYLIQLPLKIAWPVLASASIWIIVVALFWTAFACRADERRLAKSLKAKASFLAAIIAVPKLLLVGSWMIRS